MLKYFYLLFTILCCYGFSSWKTSKINYPQDYFSSPVTHKILLSGTFGELRPNHLHAGIDIKAIYGKTGEPILAAAEGFISRINVKSGGYGRAIYMDHPNGYTTVYAHLQKFSPAVEAYIKKEQYARKQFEITVYPDSTQFNFAKGDKIGTLGLSGRSFGPHLHFEIRDTNTEEPINPLLFGIHIEDKLKPLVQGIKVYELNEHKETIQEKKFWVKKKASSYKLDKDTLYISSWRAGFGIETYDQMNGAPNKNGVYTLDLLVDDSLIYSFNMERFSFDETRYINAHLDYKERISNRDYFNRCFRLPGNKLSIYEKVLEDGIVQLSLYKAKKIRFECTDVNNNQSTLEFWVKRKEVEVPTTEVYNYKLIYNEENIVQTGEVELYFPQGCLYENLYLKYLASIDTSNNIYSKVFHIHDRETAIHKYFDLSIKSSNIPSDSYDKAFIAYCNKDGSYTNCGGLWSGHFLNTKVRELGDYCIKIDKEAPVIKLLNLNKDNIAFKVIDNFGTARNVSGLKMEAKIDGNWALFEWDAKNDLLKHKFDGSLNSGKHHLLLKVEDAMGNASLFEKEFTL